MIQSFGTTFSANLKNLSSIFLLFLKEIKLKLFKSDKEIELYYQVMFFCYALYYSWFIYLFIYFSDMLNMLFNKLLVYQLTLISNLTNWLMLDDKISEPSESSTHINLSKGVKILLILRSFLHDEKKKKKRKILKIR